MLALGALLTACGGGGNESGPADAVFLSTTSVQVGGPGHCMVGRGPTVHVYGGTPPYQLTNSVPQGMVLDRAVVQDSGDGFVITFINGVCMRDMPITAEDRMGRLGQVRVSNGE